MGQLHSELPLSNVLRWWDGSKHAAYAKRWLSISRPVNTVADLTAFIKDPHLRLSVALTAQHCTEPRDLQTHFLHYTYIFIQSSEENNFLSYLTFRQKYLKPLKFPFVWVQHSSARGKQALLLESLFKESDLQWVPPTPAPANGVSAPSCTKTSQARPFLHTRQKNAQCCSLLLPQMLLRMFGKKAEMTGTTIRLPYLEKMA